MRRLALISLASIACLSAGGAVAHAATARHLGDRPLRVGSHGADVRSLQRLLARDGFHVTIDGQFGPGTLAAVRHLQRAAGLAVDGVVKAATITALRAAVNGGAAAPAATPAAEPDPTSTPAATAPAVTPTTLDPPAQATLVDGQAVAPAGAPSAVVAAIAAANHIDTLPYRYGGGHAQWEDTAYDCSGSVGYALHGAGLISTTMTSGQLAQWGQSGPGRWITIYANADHTWVVIAGLRFDTSRYDTGTTVKDTGPRWRSGPRPTDGFVMRHPAGL